MVTFDKNRELPLGYSSSTCDSSDYIRERQTVRIQSISPTNYMPEVETPVVDHVAHKRDRRGATVVKWQRKATRYKVPKTKSETDT